MAKSADAVTPKSPNAQQAKRLRDRVEYAQHRLSRAVQNGKGKDEPAKITAARKLIEEYDRDQRAKRDRAYEAVSENARKVQDVILFGTLDEALDAVAKLEAAAAKALPLDV